MLNDLFFLRNMVSFDTFSFRIFYKHLINNEKESLNNDGQQFHQYQQNEQPSLISNYSAQKKKWLVCV